MNKVNKITTQAHFGSKLPEKVLQFGTGILLRALPDYFIDKANRMGVFNGSIVVVKSTAKGEVDAFRDQDNVYTVCVRGYENGQPTNENVIISSISRVIVANENWDDVLDACAQPELRIVISNTTEAGLVLREDNIADRPPSSFPGKLLACLYHRYKVLNGEASAGMVIIPTELIPDNGIVLKTIVLELARMNKLDEPFIRWVEDHNYFCSSLVDRIVPGKPGKDALEKLYSELGYYDELLMIAEPYKLWAIEAPDTVKEIIEFHTADSNVFVGNDISTFRELKLRLLNGTHTFCCALALLKNFRTVSQATEDPVFLRYMRNLMVDEITPSIQGNISNAEKNAFTERVIDRFRNNYFEHKWMDISNNYTLKLRTRNLPLVLEYYRLFQKVPLHFAVGFAAFIMLMKPNNDIDVNDEYAAIYHRLWNTHANEGVASVVREVLRSDELWGTSLDNLAGFTDAVCSVANVLNEQDAQKLDHYLTSIPSVS